MKRIMRRKTEMNAELNCMSHLQMCKKKNYPDCLHKNRSWNFESDDAKKTSKDFVLNCECLHKKPFMEFQER